MPPRRGAQVAEETGFRNGRLPAPRRAAEMRGGALRRAETGAKSSTTFVLRWRARLQSSQKRTDAGLSLTERRRSRTYPPTGYAGSPVLKTGWATGPGPLRPQRSARRAAQYDRLRVHGLIFASFRDFITVQYGPGIAKSILEGQPVHLLTEAYPDEDFLAVVGKACEQTRVETDDLVREFGVFAGETTFPHLYPAFYSVAGGARSFLLTVEALIHELVRATIPNATPPQLLVTPLDEDGVQIEYSSPRRLCILVRGLVDGTARHYGEKA